MKKNTIILIFLAVTNVFTQTKNNITTYKVTSNTIKTKSFLKNKKISPEMKEMVSSFINTDRHIICKLYHNENESLFFKSNKLNSPVQGRGKLLDILVGNGIFYKNKKDTFLLNQKQFMGDLFIVEMKPFVWQLTQETKTINGYLCYKAVGVKTTENDLGTFKNEVTAWYTPSIPCEFGIREYIGLPGLILELNDGKLFYRVNKIELNTRKRLNIKKPVKGKYLNEIEYKALVKNLYYQKTKRN